MVTWRKKWPNMNEYTSNYQTEYVYIIKKYIYDDMWIVVILKEYNQAIRYFTKYKYELENGCGLILYKYQYNKSYDFIEAGENELLHVFKDYGGTLIE